MTFLIPDYQGFIKGVILKMPKFTQLIFEYCYIDCLFINFGILRPERRKIQVNFPG